MAYGNYLILPTYLMCMVLQGWLLVVGVVAADTGDDEGTEGKGVTDKES